MDTKIKYRTKKITIVEITRKATTFSLFLNIFFIKMKVITKLMNILINIERFILMLLPMPI